MIKITTTKKWNQMVKDLEEVRSANVGLHELLKGHYNKYGVEIAEKEKAIVERDTEIAKLRKALNKAEHDKCVAFKKLKKYESRGK